MIEEHEAVNEASSNATDLPADDEPVLVGRGPELALFKKILNDAHPLLVVITGGAGLGKSSLLHAFKAHASAAGWNTAPGPTSETLPVSPETTEENFTRQLQTLITVPSGESFIEKPLGKTETPSDQQPLLPIVEQLRCRAPLLLLVDSYEPAPGFADWFQSRFIKDIKGAGAPIVVVVAERPEGATKLSPTADEIMTLGTLGEDAIRQHFKIIGEKISPPMVEEELNVYIDAAQKEPEMLSSLTRVFRLALQSETKSNGISM